MFFPLSGVISSWWQFLSRNGFFIPGTIVEESPMPGVIAHKANVISTLPAEAYSKIQELHVPIKFIGVIGLRVA